MFRPQPPILWVAVVFESKTSCLQDIAKHLALSLVNGIQPGKIIDQRQAQADQLLKIIVVLVGWLF